MNKIRKSTLAGLLILLAVILGVSLYAFFRGRQVSKLSISGYVGGEKINYLEDPEVSKILRKDYGLSLDIRKAGSLDMVRAQDLSSRDFLWPSSQTALELYEDTVGPAYKDENIFNTPIVLYSRSKIAEALVSSGLAHKEGEVFFADMPALIEAVKANKSWSDIGLPELYGDISIHTTDPSKSNSGNMFSGLAANMLNHNKVISEGQVPQILPELNAIFEKIGYMETSSSDLFRLFLRTGMGNKPIVAGYENQLLEFSKMQPEDWENVKENIVIIYPSPTVWSSHIFIALNDKGARLMEALQDERLQKIAWEKHGFRSGVYGSGSGSSASGASGSEAGFDVPGVAPEITRIIQMPGYRAMSQIVKNFE